MSQTKKQNQTYIVKNLSRPILHGFNLNEKVEENVVGVQSSELGQYNGIEVEQSKPRKILKKEYDSMNIRYTNEDYSYLLNLLLSRFSESDSAAIIATQYPLFKMLRGVTRKLMLNELETIFFLQTIEEQKWNYDDQLISEFSPYFKQDFLSNQENHNVEGFKKLLLFLICCGYAIKCYCNDSNDKEIILITDHIQQYCQKDFKKSLLDQWKQKCMNGSLKITPRDLNKLYIKLLRTHKDGRQQYQKDHNSLVDQIIELSPAYQNNNQEAKLIKQEIKPVQQHQQTITFSQQNQQSFQQQPYMNNSGIFLQFQQPQIPPQQSYFQTFSPFNNQDFCDQNINESLFINSNKIKEEMPQPPPLVSQSSNFKIV